MNLYKQNWSLMVAHISLKSHISKKHSFSIASFRPSDFSASDMRVSPSHCIHVPPVRMHFIYLCLHCDGPLVKDNSLVSPLSNVKWEAQATWSPHYHSCKLFHLSGLRQTSSIPSPHSLTTDWCRTHCDVCVHTTMKYFTVPGGKTTCFLIWLQEWTYV